MSSSTNGADIYLILLRPTRVPVAGEAVSHLFQGQILLESLSWRLHNEDEQLQGAGDGKGGKASLIKGDNPAAMIKNLNQDVARAQASLKRDIGKAGSESERNALQDKHDKWLSKSMDEAQRKIEQAAGMADSTKKSAKDKPAGKGLESAGDRNPSFKFTFGKRVDIASTQMLNSMKAGDIFPSGTLTIHRRSASVMDGTSLVFTIQKIRLVEYQLQVAVTDTMTEMMEQWTCEFGSLAYVYKNPPSHYSHGNAGQAAAKTLSQGTMRAFTMKNIGSPI
jgi:type VI protein secretion system component Hcp